MWVVWYVGSASVASSSRCCCRAKGGVKWVVWCVLVAPVLRRPSLSLSMSSVIIVVIVVVIVHVVHCRGPCIRVVVVVLATPQAKRLAAAAGPVITVVLATLQAERLVAGAGPVIVIAISHPVSRGSQRWGRNVVIMNVNLDKGQKVSCMHKETIDNKFTWAQMTSVVVWTQSET